MDGDLFCGFGDFVFPKGDFQDTFLETGIHLLCEKLRGKNEIAPETAEYSFSFVEGMLVPFYFRFSFTR